MRIAAILWALATPVTFANNSISEEFAAGFGGVPWGTEFSELVARFPGGHEMFSTTPGRISYTLNIEDPVVGLPRSGQYVSYGIGADGKVDIIAIQVAYDQTAILLSTLKSRFGPERGTEITGVVTTYRWPVDHGMSLVLRTTNGRGYGLTTLEIAKRPQTAAPRAPTAKSN